MPPQLGDFISRSIYSGQLKSWDKHPVTEDIQALYLINVKEGKERKTQAESFEVRFLFLILKMVFDHCLRILQKQLLSSL